jgi:phasin family protein
MSTTRKTEASSAAKRNRKPAARRPAKTAAKAAPARRAVPAKAATQAALVTGAPARLFAGYDRIASFHRDTADAVMESGQAVARGVEDAGRLWADFGQTSLQDGAAVLKTLSGIRTLQELMEAQADLLRLVVERLLVEGERLSELSARVARDAVSPLRARLDSALGQFARQAA